MKHTEDLKREAVKIALSSGLSRTRISADFGMDGGLPSDVPPENVTILK
ncbi:transposase [Novacetimonas sp. GS1]